MRFALAISVFSVVLAVEPAAEARTKKTTAAAKRRESLKAPARSARRGIEARERGGAKPPAAPSRRRKARPRRQRLDPIRSRGVVVAPAPAHTDPDRARIERLQDELTAHLTRGPLARAHVGVEVRSLDGKLLYAQNPGTKFDPASNQKILTTAAALTLLGPHWKYRTVLAGPRPNPEGVIVGDVYLRGSGDPLLGFGDLAEIARETARLGITRITGGIVVEEHGVNPAGAPLDTSGEGDDLGYAPLTLNKNRVFIRVTPGAVGDEPLVVIDPPVFHLSNDAVTVGRGRGALSVDIEQSGTGPGVVRVSGRVRAGRSYAFRRRPPKPALYTAAALTRVLNDFGIVVEKAPRAGRPTATAMVLGEHETPLSKAIRPSNIFSNNFVAERIFQTVGGELYGYPASPDKGQRAVRELMKRHNIPLGEYETTNGSGLAHCNRITPGALNALLRRLWYDLEVAPDFISSLSVAGVSGTTRRSFAGHPSVGLVRAKTGTLRGKIALSGYVGDKDDVVVFSIMVDGFSHGRRGVLRTAEAQLVDAMLRYARKTQEPQPAPPGIVAPPAEPDGSIQLPDDEADDEGDGEAEQTAAEAS